MKVRLIWIMCIVVSLAVHVVWFSVEFCGKVKA